MLLRMMAMPLSFLDYSVNRRFIAEQLCENRYNTAIHCAGSCYLKRQLNKANDSQESGEQKATSKAPLDYFEPLTDLLATGIKPASLQHASFHIYFITDQPEMGILRPPIA